MEIAPLPADEEQRLIALYEYKILDTPYEDIFDIVTKLAASICDTPISLISLVDRDRQWLKSTKGLDVKETSRDVAFCSHTILGFDLMEVSDATQDKRFHDNPLVVGDPKIRFYAGMPLTNPEGFKLGTLCVIDREPKNLTDDQKEKLRHLSKIVMTLFESKKLIIKDLTERTCFSNQLKDVNNQLAQQLSDQNKNNHIILLFSQMNGMLQSCMTNEEAYAIISKFCQQIFLEAAGSLYLISASRDYLELAISWKNPKSLDEFFPPEDCWALRRGQYYLVDNPKIDLICKHFQGHSSISTYMCLPLVAQSETLGLLCLECSNNIEDCHKKSSSETQHLFAVRMAEQISLSLANIKLRQTLRHQSICDPLTGLYNRRYLAEVFKRELPRAIRKNTHLGVIMIDIDHFKRFNDNFGHDAGDVVLKKLAELLQHHAREHDFACRLGGEEFVLLLRDVSMHDIQQRAEQLRKAVSCLELKYAGKELGVITISLGIASSPEHGQKLEDLINAADNALYKAKETGRDRVVTFSE